MSSRPLTLALLGFAALGAAVLGAYVHERLNASPGRAADAVPIHDAAPSPAEIRIPELRPVFVLADLDGHRHSITEWDGKALVVNFWATWCAPCRREIPLLNRIQHEYSPKGFEVVGIAVDFVKDVRDFRAKIPLDYPLLVGEQDGLDAAEAFGVATVAFPFTAFTDNHGRVLAVHMGELHEAEARAILGVAGRVNAGALTPAAARDAIRAALAALPLPGPASGP